MQYVYTTFLLQNPLLICFLTDSHPTADFEFGSCWKSKNIIITPGYQERRDQRLFCSPACPPCLKRVPGPRFQTPPPCLSDISGSLLSLWLLPLHVRRAKRQEGNEDGSHYQSRLSNQENIIHCTETGRQRKKTG